MLMLDALFPPSPDQLVIDCRAVGASGAFAYVARPGGIGTWTRPHVDALRAAGLHSSPIIVPAPAGQDIGQLLAVVNAFGFTLGPITLDLETPNLPPATWEEQFDAAVKAAGFHDLDYGRPADLGLYQPDDQDWKARWLRTGILDPIPTLPAGWHAWQFVDDVPINGTQYDVSVVADSVFGNPPKEIDMLMLHPPTGLGVLVSGDLVVPLPADGTTEALQAAGVQVVNVTQAFFDNVISAAAVVQGSVKGSLNVSGLLNVARGVGA